MVDRDVRMTLNAASAGLLASNNVLHVDAFMRIETLEDGRIRVTVFDRNRAVYQEMYHYVQDVLIRSGGACDFRDSRRTEPPWSFSFAPVKRSS